MYGVKSMDSTKKIRDSLQNAVFNKVGDMRFEAAITKKEVKKLILRDVTYYINQALKET